MGLIYPRAEDVKIVDVYEQDYIADSGPCPSIADPSTRLFCEFVEAMEPEEYPVTPWPHHDGPGVFIYADEATIAALDKMVAEIDGPTT